VCKDRCRHCLFGDDSLVEQETRINIIRRCAEGNTHFNCHESTERGEEVMCRGWWDEFRDLSNLGRGLERLGYDPDVHGWVPKGPATDRDYASATRMAKKAVAERKP
jgi:hypothetical protein